jgi:two-component system, sensor histidine kinase and response regulator
MRSSMAGDYRKPGAGETSAEKRAIARGSTPPPSTEDEWRSSTWMILRVLVAEDDPLTRVVARRILEARGHAVTAVEDGPSAVEAARADPFDVVLIDLDLPGLGGREVAAEIRAGGTTKPPAFVAMTASAVPGERERCLAAGLDGYLEKPFAAAALIEAVERAAGDPLRRELIALLAEEGPATLSRLRDAVVAGEAAAVGAAAHRLASSLGAVGAARGVLIAGAIEQEAAVGKLDDVAALTEALAAELARALGGP